MRDDLKKIQKRTVQYWFADGLVEIAFAGLCLLLALYFYALAVLPEGSLLFALLNASMVIILVGGSLLSRKLIVKLKARLTYRRTGYISYPVKPSRPWAGALLSMGIAALAAFLFIQQPGTLVWMPGIIGIVFSFVMLLMGLRTNLLRLYLLGIIALLVGGGLSLAGIGDILGLSAFFGAFALVLALSGFCALRTYLRDAPPEEPGNAS